MSFRCLSVFGRMFEYLPRISLKHSNMILVRIPSPNRNILHCFIIVVVCDWIDFFPGSGMVSVWCLFKCHLNWSWSRIFTFLFALKANSKSLHTLVPIFQKPKYFHALLAPFGFFTKTLPSMLVTLKVENEAGWKFHLKVCQITHKSIFARGHNLRKRMPNIHIRFEYLTFKKVPAKYSNIRISVPALFHTLYIFFSVFLFEFWSLKCHDLMLWFDKNAVWGSIVRNFSDFHSNIGDWRKHSRSAGLVLFSPIELVQPNVIFM